MEIYNKLVRDKIPQIIASYNKTADIEILPANKFPAALNNKLLEEVKEYLGSSNIEEIADILEVIESILSLHHISWEEIFKMKEEKKERNGGFDKKFFLRTVE